MNWVLSLFTKTDSRITEPVISIFGPFNAERENIPYILIGPLLKPGTCIQLIYRMAEQESDGQVV